MSEQVAVINNKPKLDQISSGNKRGLHPKIFIYSIVFTLLELVGLNLSSEWLNLRRIQIVKVLSVGVDIFFARGWMSVIGVRVLRKLARINIIGGR